MDQNQSYNADNCLCGLETVRVSCKEKAHWDQHKEKVCNWKESWAAGIYTKN